ncbi:hypothetical protein BSKO_04895 [Bryopsis sp. KO-2023]|nr:hypothetical protein BSKO_04895 [Bryopsis sp. KO-2023]
MRNLEHLDVCPNSYGDMLHDLALDTGIQLCRVPGDVVLCGQRLEEVENCPVLFGLIIEILWVLEALGVLRFDISVGLFTLSMVASFVSILAGMVKFGCKRLENASGPETTPQVHENGICANGAEVSGPLLSN